MKHTPGPWEVDKVKKHPWVVTCTDKNLGCQNTLVEVGYKPNARLISAAPKLYEVCKYLAENGWNAGVSEMAREAIAKAEEA